MTGPYNSVSGRDKESVLFKLQTSMLAPFTVAQGDVRMAGALVRLDTPREQLYCRHGGILHYVLRKLLEGD